MSEPNKVGTTCTVEGTNLVNHLGNDPHRNEPTSNKTCKNSILWHFWVKKTTFKTKSQCVTYPEMDILATAPQKIWELTHYDFQILWEYINKCPKRF